MSDDLKSPGSPSDEANSRTLAEGVEDEVNGSVPEEAIIMPDDPIRHTARGVPGDALISPDDPVVRTPSEGIVTGMAGQAEAKRATGWKLAAGGREWNIRHAADLLANLSDEMREQGVAALRTHPEMEPLDGMLRGLVAGFLLGRQDE